MQIKDLQLARYLLTKNELNTHSTITQQILNTELEIHPHAGEPDAILIRNNKVICYQPTSITKFLFNVLNSKVSHFIDDNIQKDKLALGLLKTCKDYVYYDQKSEEKPPVIISFDKLAIPSTIIRELIEPIIGKIEDIRLICMKSTFVDTCDIIDSADKFIKQYGVKPQIGYGDFPLLLTNISVYNEAARSADIISKYLKLTLSEDGAEKVIKHILLDEDTGLFSQLVLILRTMHPSPVFVLDFIRFLQCGIILTEDEQNQTENLAFKVIQSDNYLKQHLTKEADGLYNSTVQKQWSQWSMLMGLIEKQLSPMRGSMWPTTENMKPHDFKLKKLIQDRCKAKNKNQLNFEELLEVTRDFFDHNAVEPGQLTELLIKDKRIWR